MQLKQEMDQVTDTSTTEFTNFATDLTPTQQTRLDEAIRILGEILLTAALLEPDPEIKSGNCAGQSEQKGYMVSILSK